MTSSRASKKPASTRGSSLIVSDPGTRCRHTDMALSGVAFIILTIYHHPSSARQHSTSIGPSELLLTALATPSDTQPAWRSPSHFCSTGKLNGRMAALLWALPSVTPPLVLMILQAPSRTSSREMSRRASA